MRRITVIVLGALGAAAALGATGGAAAETGPLHVGFGVRTITPHGTPPEGWDFWVNPVTGIWSEEFTDQNDNAYFDPGEPFVDDPANTLLDPQSAGKFDGCWTNAGFGGRGPLGVLDDVGARAMVLSAGDTKVAIVSLDVVGFFYEEVERVRALLDQELPGHGIDEVVVSSTHTHESCDTMGLWGNPTGLDGKFPKWQDYIRHRIVEAIAEADGTLAPTLVKAATTEHLPAGDIRDSRPPQVFDPYLQAAQFRHADSGDVLGTIVNWSNHPEALWSGNRYISSDFPHGARSRLEAEFGGTAVYFSGSVGGLMTTGNQPTRYVEIGENVAAAAIAALENAPLEEIDTLEVVSKEVFMPGDNYSLRALNAAGVFDKPTYVAGLPAGPFGDEFKTQLVSIKAGSMRFQTVPGELFPEIELGIYGREDCPEADTGRPYEPGIAQQWTEPHLFTLGLAQDELGYIVPGYDFWIFGVPNDEEEPAPRPLIDIGVEQADDPCGEGHYEETVSASSVMAPVVACTIAELAGKDPWNDLESYPACSPENTTVGPQGLHLDALTP